jgi:hypothetical protein
VPLAEALFRSGETARFAAGFAERAVFTEQFHRPGPIVQ